MPETIMSQVLIEDIVSRVQNFQRNKPEVKA